MDYSVTVDAKFTGLKQAALFDNAQDVGNSLSTDDVVKEICRLSAEGYGVTHITKAMGLPQNETLNWLQKYHGEAIKSAKKKQLANPVAKDKYVAIVVAEAPNVG